MPAGTSRMRFPPSRRTTSAVPSSEPAAGTTIQTRSAPRTISNTHGSTCCSDNGGRSTSWNATSSNDIIPGTGSCVVNGYAATSGVAWVSFVTRADLPALGGPASAT